LADVGTVLSPVLTRSQPGAEALARTTNGFTFLQEAATIDLKRVGKSNDALRRRTAAQSTSPMSFAQQRPWLLEQLIPGTPAYNSSVGLRVSGPLDSAALERAFHHLIARHEALRTAIVTFDGSPILAVAATANWSLSIVKPAGRSSRAEERAARRLFLRDARKSFDLTRPPLLRATLIRLRSEENILITTIHHIVTDWQSTEVLINELWAHYHADLAGDAASGLAQVAQYSEFAEWQRQHLNAEGRTHLEGYWLPQLADPPVLKLPIDRPRSPVQSFRGGIRYFRSSKTPAAALIHFSAAQRATPFIVLLAAWSLVLHWYAGVTDLLVGVPLANRRNPRFVRCVGFVANTVVIRVKLEHDPTFLDLVGRVRDAAVEAHAHEDVPFEMLAELVASPRDPSRSRLFQVMFAQLDDIDEAQPMPGIRTKRLRRADSGTETFDLSMAVAVRPDGIQGFLKYDAALFERQTIGHLVWLFQKLILDIVRDPAQRLSQFDPRHWARSRPRHAPECPRCQGQWPQSVDAAGAAAAREPRIDTRRIETELEQHPAVGGRSVVVAEFLPNGGQQLVAYVLPNGQSPVNPAAVQATLEAALPRELVPDRIFFAATSSGIVLGGQESGLAGAIRETERRLSALYGELLEITPPLASADFFNLGGDSLLAVRLMARIQAEFLTAVPLSLILQCPTIERLAIAIAAIRPSG
jgi:non-ribosomal peptide synthetase component F/acyl carrier protein